MSMPVMVNGQLRELPLPWRIADLVADMGLSGKRIAVELNGQIVPKSHYGEIRLVVDDRVEIVAAVGGG